MIKQVSPYMWDYGEDPISLVKVSSHGLVGSDLKSFVKRAGDEAAHRLKLIVKDLPKDEDYVHMLAMGASEIISPNKNGDGWKEAILKRSYQTFVKFGFYHRNHKVEETEGVYGKIRDAWYNHKMGRVELITGFFTTKEAAQRGHAKRGRVADKELQILNSGADLPVSMSGFVPFDICSGCSHKAAHRKNYCDANICKYGGLKRNIGKVFEDGVHLHADNPDTKFFDISGIFNEQTLSPERQADRIAYSLGRLKAASVSDFERLEPQVLPLPILADINEWVGKQASLLSSMREIEVANSGLTYFGSAAEGYQFGPDIFSPISMQSLNKLAKEGICLSLDDFAKACGTPGLATAAKAYAKTALQNLSESEYLPELLENNPFKFREVFSSPDPRKALFLMTPEAVRKRAWLNGAVETAAETDTPVESHAAEELANLHALYRLGFCASFPKSSNLLLLSSYIARHNL